MTIPIRTSWILVNIQVPVAWGHELQSLSSYENTGRKDNTLIPAKCQVSLLSKNRRKCNNFSQMIDIKFKYTNK